MNSPVPTPPAAVTPGRKVLVVEDNELNRELIDRLLRRHGYQTIHAHNGAEGVAAFARERPDIVLMDIQMPVMDGYEATRRIRAAAGATFVPVMFLTADTNEQALARCVEVGGDDFLTKPYSWVILQARINALLRIRELYDTVQAQRDELSVHQQRLAREHDVAQRVFKNILHPESLHRSNIRYHLSPMSLFSGDMLLVAERPGGGLNVIVGDFTGHGLAAAIGALPASDVFYQMTAKGYPLGKIMAEINQKLHAVLPIGMFLAACAVELDPHTRTAAVWNGGLPDLLVYGAHGRSISHRVPSSRVPLGVLGPASFDGRTDLLDMRTGDRLYLYSDGVTETRSLAGEMFGQARVDTLLGSGVEAQCVFDTLLCALDEYRGGTAQDDDVTLIEVVFDDALRNAHAQTTPMAQAATTAGAWAMRFELEASTLVQGDPLPSIVQLVAELQGLARFRQDLFTVLAELYTNALDHGLLGLDSALKATPEGFVRYYQERVRRLAQLNAGRLVLSFRHEPCEGGGRLWMSLEDSGAGFQYADGESRIKPGSDGFAGRGIHLVRSLCESVVYKGAGNVVEACYRWSYAMSVPPRM